MVDATARYSPFQRRIHSTSPSAAIVRSTATGRCHCEHDRGRITKAVKYLTHLLPSDADIDSFMLQIYAALAKKERTVAAESGTRRFTIMGAY
jgi:hypothetical protein